MKRLIGVILSVVALVVTAFFVFLAIETYSHFKESRKELDNIQREINRLGILLKSYTSSLDTGLEMIIVLSEKTPKSERYQDAMELEQARLSYLIPMSDKERQKALLRKLADIGKFEDIFWIQKYIADNPDESEEMKELAKVVLERLMIKWKKP